MCPRETRIQYIYAVHFHRGQRWTVPCSSLEVQRLPQGHCDDGAYYLSERIDPVTFGWWGCLSYCFHAIVAFQWMFFLSQSSVRGCSEMFIHSRWLSRQTEKSECWHFPLSMFYGLWNLVQEWKPLPFALCSSNLFYSCMLSIFARSPLTTVKLLYVKWLFLLCFLIENKLLKMMGLMQEHFHFLILNSSYFLCKVCLYSTSVTSQIQQTHFVCFNLMNVMSSKACVVWSLA